VLEDWLKLPYEELFDHLAKVYIEQELLINKISDGIEISLSEAENMVNELIKDEVLLKLIRMLDRFFLIRRHPRSHDSFELVRAYRNRLDQFISHTIGIEKYVSILGLTREGLEESLKKDVEELLKRKEAFPLLEAQLSILLRWLGR
jgi:hypothetical protein